MKNCRKIYTDKYCNLIIQDNFDEAYVNIYIIQHITANGITNTQIFLKEKESDTVICTIKKDGHYNICKIDVPLDSLKCLYYYKDGKFYKNIQEVNIEEVISVNPNVSGLNFEYEDYFSKCHLWQCYVKICQEIFDTRTSLKCDNPNISSESIYKRDLLNSTINVIDYMVSLGQYSEASRLLERISGCNGLCKTTENCGCL